MHVNEARPADALVSIGLPVRNGGRTLEGVVRSVLTQDHERIELVISDNASTDDTEQVCRDLAASDPRIVYHRHPVNVGLLNNFMGALNLAKGTFFRWIGDDDSLNTNYVSRCLQEFTNNSRLMMVTTQLKYVLPDGSDYTVACPDTTLSSDDRIQRFEKLISYLIDSSLPLDPLYALARRDSLLRISRRNMFGEDEVYAAKLALAGPWGHVPDVMGIRNVRIRGYGLARFLDVPQWQAYVPTSVECWELLQFLRTTDLTEAEQSRARSAVWRLFVRRHRHVLVRRVRKLKQKVLG